MLNEQTETKDNPSIESRLVKLEDTVTALQNKPSFSWSQGIEIFSKILVPLLLFWLAFTFKDSVQYALEYKRFEVQSAESIEKLLLTLNKSDVGKNEASAAAVTLSAYGDTTIIPLVTILENGSPNAQNASKRGLFVIGLTHPNVVSEKLLTILSKQQGQFRWQTHKAIIEILGKIAHPDAKQGLLDYQALITLPGNEGETNWKKMVRDVSPEGYNNTLESLERSLAILGAA